MFWQRAGAIPPEQIKRASGEVLERLIDQELFVQQAMAKKLDRSVAVVQAVEAAKREIYARAYVEQITAQAAKPDAAAITAFYNENPALFAKRRIYNLQELNVQIADEKIPALMQKIGDAKNVVEIANWLRAEKIPFSANAGVKAAEQLPPDAGSPIRRGEGWPGGSVAGARWHGHQLYRRIARAAARRKGRDSADRAIDRQQEENRARSGGAEAPARNGHHRVHGRVRKTDRRNPGSLSGAGRAGGSSGYTRGTCHGRS